MRVGRTKRLACMARGGFPEPSRWEQKVGHPARRLLALHLLVAPHGLCAPRPSKQASRTTKPEIMHNNRHTCEPNTGVNTCSAAHLCKENLINSTQVVSWASAQDCTSGALLGFVSEHFVLHWVLQSATKSWKQKTHVLKNRGCRQRMPKGKPHRTNSARSAGVNMGRDGWNRLGCVRCVVLLSIYSVANCKCDNMFKTTPGNNIARIKILLRM